jgi:hypothetical protein
LSESPLVFKPQVSGNAAYCLGELADAVDRDRHRVDRLLHDAPMPTEVPQAIRVPAGSSEPRTAKTLRHCDWSTSRRVGRVRRDALIQFLIDDLDRTVDFGIGCAKLMRNQLHQQVDAFDGRRATSDRPGR